LRTTDLYEPVHPQPGLVAVDQRVSVHGGDCILKHQLIAGRSAELVVLPARKEPMISRAMGMMP
jgi:hypothetical protein